MVHFRRAAHRDQQLLPRRFRGPLPSLYAHCHAMLFMACLFHARLCRSPRLSTGWYQLLCCRAHRPCQVRLFDSSLFDSSFFSLRVVSLRLVHARAASWFCSFSLRVGVSVRSSCAEQQRSSHSHCWLVVCWYAHAHQMLACGHGAEAH